MKVALVTGGMGFIGNHLVNHLLLQGIKVWVLDKSIHKPTFCDIKKATIVEGDVLSHQLLHDCLMQVDTCFHLAALSSVAGCSRDWIFSHENNVLAFNGLLEEIRRLPHRIKLIYTSSAAVYGDSPILPSSEAQHVVPRSTYGADKLSNEIYAEVIRGLYGIPAIGLRLFNVYGPGSLKTNPYSGVITVFKQALANNQPLPIYGDGQQTRDFINVKDIIRAYLLAAATPEDFSGVFNICSGRAVSIKELAQIMIDLSNKKGEITYLNARNDDLLHSRGDASLAKKELLFEAQVSIHEGLDLFLQDQSFPY